MKTAFIQLHIAIFLAGLTAILGRLIDLNEGMLVWYRMLFTCIVLWLMHYFAKDKATVSADQRVRIYAVGAIVALHWVTFYGSIKYANVSIALICFSSIGFFTALMEPLLTRRRIHATELLLGLLTVAGIAIIFHFDAQYKTGIIIGLISAVLASLFPIMNRKLLQQNDASTITREEMTGGFLALTVLLPFYLWLFPAGNYAASVQDIGWLLVLSLLCTVLAFNLSMRALRHISAFTVNLSFNLEPVYGIILAFLIFREDKFLSGSFYIGFALIVLSVLLQTLLVLHKRRYATSKPVTQT